MRPLERRVVHCPPSWNAILSYAKEVSQALAHSVGPSFADPEVARGLAIFIQVVAGIYAKKLNTELGKVDKDRE